MTPADVWLVPTDVGGPLRHALATLLDEEERRRADTLLAGRDRRRFTVAHGAARMLAGQYCGVAPERIRWARGPHGKPELAWPATGAGFSLSHSGDLIAVALTPGRRVGVDVQCPMPGLDPVRMSARYFPATEAHLVAAAPGPAEAAEVFLRLWTRKEACVKVAGGRLLPGLRLPVLGGGPISGYLIRDIRVPPGFHGAVAVEGAEPCRVRCHTWPDPAQACDVGPEQILALERR